MYVSFLEQSMETKLERDGKLHKVVAHCLFDKRFTRHLRVAKNHATLKLYDDKKYPEDNNGVEKERSSKTERLMRRQIEAMVGKARRNRFGVEEMLKLDNLRADHFGEYVCSKRRETAVYTRKSIT